MAIYITGVICVAYIGAPFIRIIVYLLAYLHKSKSQRSSEECADTN